jgi:ATP-dependent protease Clp ATPase subunit
MTPTCSFCGKSKDEVQVLVKGPAAAICDECVSMARDILTEELDRHAPLAKPSSSLGQLAGLFEAVADRLGETPQTRLLAAEARSLAEAIPFSGMARS